MPLLINGKRIDVSQLSREQLYSYPELKESAKLLRSQPAQTVGPRGLLYVQQREFAATTPKDGSVSVLGSDDATTCHLVVLRHTDRSQDQNGPGSGQGQPDIFGASDYQYFISQTTRTQEGCVPNCEESENPNVTIHQLLAVGSTKSHSAGTLPPAKEHVNSYLKRKSD